MDIDTHTQGVCRCTYLEATLWLQKNSVLCCSTLRSVHFGKCKNQFAGTLARTLKLQHGDWLKHDIYMGQPKLWKLLRN